MTYCISIVHVLIPAGNTSNYQIEYDKKMCLHVLSLFIKPFNKSNQIFVTEEDTSVVVGQEEEDGEEDVDASTEGRGVSQTERQKQESRCKCKAV